jgi:hypothetical protein
MEKMKTCDIYYVQQILLIESVIKKVCFCVMKEQSGTGVEAPHILILH